MIRIVQLLEHHAEFETERGASALSQRLGGEFDVCRRTIGFGGDWRDLATAAASLRRVAANFDLVHACGRRALTVAALGTRSPIVFSPDPEARRKDIGWLRAVMQYRRVECVCATATMHRRLVQQGIDVERCHLIRPGVDFSRARSKRDVELRERLGFREDDLVFLAIGESTRSANHADALWTVGILHVADAKHRMLAWGRGAMADSLRRLALKVDRPELLCVASDRLGAGVDFESLLSAADVGLLSARDPVATLPIAICMASGLPIVAAATPTAGELLEDRHSALMIAPGNPRLMARRALDLLEDPRMKWSLADTARTEAYEYFSQARFVEQHREMYRQLGANERVQISQPPPGAGTRFLGRV